MVGISASFAQGPTVKVSWDDSNCSCVTLPVYFKVTISIYDDANSTWVIQNKTFNTPDGTYSDIVFDVPEVIDYCKATHDFTPSFTVSATVWLILVGGKSVVQDQKVFRRIAKVLQTMVRYQLAPLSYQIRTLRFKYFPAECIVWPGLFAIFA